MTVHRYAYDQLGRQTSDTVAPTSGNPQNIDTTVHKIERGYDDHLRLETANSVGKDNSNADITINQVGFEYNTCGQLTKDIQEHSGKKNQCRKILI